MRRAVVLSIASFCGLFLSLPSPAAAHVKWFLSKPESELLKEPKPDLFTHPSPTNVLLIFSTIAFLFASTIFARRLSLYLASLEHDGRSSIDPTILPAAANSAALIRSMTVVKLVRSLVSAGSNLARRFSSELNCIVGLTTGIGLMHCAFHRQLLAPNFIICSHCPWWLPFVEMLVGCGLFLGLFSRLAGLGMLALLVFTFFKHSLADCLDLVPMYGLSLYFICAGRGKFSLDRLFGTDRLYSRSLESAGYLAIRFSAGLGLIVLAFDEKLIHPQLALDLIKTVPRLNFMHGCMSDSLFVLCAGLTELSLGFLLCAGTFPRIAIALLALTFCATTSLFGSAELFGHAPYYGIALMVALRGRGEISPLALAKQAVTLISGLPSKALKVRRAISHQV